MPKHYFTSDLHFYHKNILKFCNRPVGNLTNEQWLFEKIDEIPRGSTLWHLGDLCFSNNELENILRYIIIGRGLELVLIVGNHDDKRNIQRLLNKIIEEFPNGGILKPTIRDYYEISKGFMESELGSDYKERLGIEADKVVLFHFPIEEFNKCHRGSLHFHGHCHGNMNHNAMVNRIDVGIDSIGKIMTLEEVILALKEQNKTSKRTPNHH